jgi:hypothetical protein
MPKNQDRLTVRLDAEMRARLHERAGALGLDDAAFVRMLIYGEINGAGYGTHIVGAAAGTSGDSWTDSARLGDSLPVGDVGLEDEPRAEDFEVEPDPDGGNPSLDQLLGAAPSLLDEMMAVAPAPQPPVRPAAPTYRSALPQRGPRQPARPQVWGAFGGVYSMTRPVGVNEYATGANTTGDGRGNVLRDNMRHFGIAGTRAR